MTPAQVQTILSMIQAALGGQPAVTSARVTAPTPHVTLSSFQKVQRPLSFYRSVSPALQTLLNPPAGGGTPALQPVAQPGLAPIMPIPLSTFAPALGQFGLPNPNQPLIPSPSASFTPLSAGFNINV